MDEATRTLLSDQLLLSTSAGHAAGVKAVLAMKIDPNTPISGKNLLCVACNCGKVDVVSELILASACVNASQEGRYAIHHAAFSNKEDVVMCLLDNAADLSQVSDKGDTVLHLACQYKKQEMVSFLLDLQVDPLLVNDAGKTALELASTDKIKEMVKSAIDNPKKTKRAKGGN